MIKVCTKNLDGIWFGVAYEGRRVFATAFAFSEQKALRCLLDHLPPKEPFEVTFAGSSFAEKTLTIMKSVYDGKNMVPEVCFSTEHLPAYTLKVLQAVSLIPVGYVTSYGAIARAIGGGARAVGNVMAANPFAPLVPCHRVVNSDFKLGGYGGGLDVKLEMLERERKGYTEPQKISVGEKLLQIFPVEFVLDKKF